MKISFIQLGILIKILLVCGNDDGGKFVVSYYARHEWFKEPAKKILVFSYVSKSVAEHSFHS